MGVTPQQDGFSNALDEIMEGDPELQRQIGEWAKKQPEEQVQAGRKTLYGVLEPALKSGEPLDKDAIARVEAIFEGIFRGVEAQTGSRQRQRS